jgi:LmbE family N-acetylglucosaminyl deacetylase
VVVTFHGSGISYHRDHRVITMATVAAVQGAAHADWYRDDELMALGAHRVRKLYGYTVVREWVDTLEWPRDIHCSSEDEITTLIDTKTTADAKWAAIQAHETQRDGPPFKVLYDAGVFEREVFVRILPTWCDGDAPEDDLLAGLD